MEIRGYRAEVGDVRALVESIRNRPVALLRADRVCGRLHLRHAAALAERAVAEGRARSADVQTETMLYAAGERQIHKAIALMGLHEGARRVAVVAWDARLADELAERHRWVRDDAVLDGSEAALDALGVDAAARAMLPRERWVELALEKAALVDVAKP